jgi:hypothetical protein
VTVSPGLTPGPRLPRALQTLVLVQRLELRPAASKPERVRRRAITLTPSRGGEVVVWPALAPATTRAPLAAEPAASPAAPVAEAVA